MATTAPGYVTNQKVVTIANNDIAINAEIATQNADNWLAVWVILSGTDVIILFTKTEAAS